MSLEEHKRRERAQAIGLFRYQLIYPALDEGLSTKQRGKLVREIAGQTHTDPFGNQVRISRETLDRWIRRHRAGGFEALVPAPRRLAAFLIEVTDTASEDLAAAGVDDATALLELNRLFTAWVETEFTDRKRADYASDLR